MRGRSKNSSMYKKGMRPSFLASWVVTILCLQLVPVRTALAFCWSTSSCRASRVSHERTYDVSLDAERRSAPDRKAPNTQKRNRSGNPNSQASKANKRTPRYSIEDNPRQSTPQTRPILTNYDVNSAPAVTQQRLQREAINCVHFQECSGCSVQAKVADIPTIQSAKSFFSSPWIRQNMARRPPTDGDFFQVVVPSPLTAWRTQAKLVAAPKSSAWAKDGIQFGLYRTRTHQVISIPECAVHHPSINRAIALLEEATTKVGIAAFDEERREGRLRYIQLQVERTTGKVCLTLVWSAETLKDTQPSLSRLVKELNRLDPDLWHSLWVNCNDSAGNNVVTRNPNRWFRISGPEFLREPLPVGDKGWLYFTPLTFRQGNLDGFDIIANDVARLVPEGSKVCELYAGVGLLGLSALAFHASENGGLKWLRCSDENPSNARCFQRAVDSLPQEWVGRGLMDSRKKRMEGEVTIAQLMERMQSGKALQPNESSAAAAERREKTSYLAASAYKALTSGQALGADVIIVDPPRKGLEDEVMNELCKPIDRYQNSVDDIAMLTIPDEMARWTNDARTLIYVSCGFEALTRDVERLLTSTAGWKLESATGYVLFPGSDHVETLCMFRRD